MHRNKVLHRLVDLRMEDVRPLRLMKWKRLSYTLHHAYTRFMGSRWTYLPFTLSSPLLNTKAPFYFITAKWIGSHSVNWIRKLSNDLYNRSGIKVLLNRLTASSRCFQIINFYNCYIIICVCCRIFLYNMYVSSYLINMWTSSCIIFT